jgi:hypothetical protein
MKYIVEMRSGAMIYVPSLIHIGSGVRSVLRGNIHMDTHGQQSNLKAKLSLLPLFSTKERRHMK